MAEKGTLFVSDMDGTLLDGNARLPSRSAELLNRAIDNGANFTVATARTAATVAPLMSGVRMKIPGIVMTGAARWDFDRQIYTDIRFHAERNVWQALDVFRHHAVTPFVYTLPETTAPHVLKVFYDNDAPTEVDEKFIAQRSNLPLKRFYISQSLTSELAGRVVLFFASGYKNALQRIADVLTAKTDCAISCYDDIYNPGCGLIEIFAAGVSKAVAIIELKKKLGLKHITVFGDNLNDIPMFEVADTSVAVGNALLEVREAANEIIGTNISESVPQYILDKTLAGI